MTKLDMENRLVLVSRRQERGGRSANTTTEDATGGDPYDDKTVLSTVGENLIELHTSEYIQKLLKTERDLCVRLSSL